MKRLGWGALVAASVLLVGCSATDEHPANPAKGDTAERPDLYRLAMKDAVAHGSYVRSKDAADADETLAEAMAGQVQGPTPVFGAYHPKGDEYGGILTVTGVYGTVLSPVTARNELQQVLDRRDNDPQVLVGPRTIHVPGSDEPLECRVAKKTVDALGDPLTMVGKECMWADASTVATVSQSIGRGSAAGKVDLKAFARRVSAIRDDVRVGI
ncbi:hypothetical protein ACWGII_41205 [Streptomyces sp. NPDC054855]